EEIKELCDELNLIHIVDPFTRKMVYGRFNYFRLHGVGGYRYRYTNDDLKRLREMCGGRDMSYCMFNNVYMYDDALRFKDLLGQ
ncbi:MAG TPA: DUF72 domain-containing protein, partial [Candidatus Latescibacteria bacterium]|nr:DUF72 domain-containing protein [Candidatus Latescibacterota bacterium]